jgi:hypothetical protein
MVHIKKVVTVALSSALTDAEADQPLSPTTLREIRLAHSLLIDGLPSPDELRPFLGGGWVIRPWSRSPRIPGINSISETEFTLAQAQALAMRLGVPERVVIDLLRHPEPEASRSRQDRIDVQGDSQFVGSRRGRGAFRSGTHRPDLMPAT